MNQHIHKELTPSVNANDELSSQTLTHLPFVFIHCTNKVIFERTTKCYHQYLLSGSNINNRKLIKVIQTGYNAYTNTDRFLSQQFGFLINYDSQIFSTFLISILVALLSPNQKLHRLSLQTQPAQISKTDQVMWPSNMMCINRSHVFFSKTRLNALLEL